MLEIYTHTEAVGQRDLSSTVDLILYRDSPSSVYIYWGTISNRLLFQNWKYYKKGRKGFCFKIHNFVLFGPWAHLWKLEQGIPTVVPHWHGLSEPWPDLDPSPQTNPPPVPKQGLLLLLFCLSRHTRRRSISRLRSTHLTMQKTQNNSSTVFEP